MIRQCMQLQRNVAKQRNTDIYVYDGSPEWASWMRMLERADCRFGEADISSTIIDEAIEKLEYLDSHEDVRAEISRTGQRRTLTDHTVQKRCEAIHEMICEYI